jgi:hypothetical protein
MKHLPFITLIILCISISLGAQVTDFTVFPEDKAIATDFIYKTGEYFYGAYYWSDQTTIIYDYRNGLRINPYSGVLLFLILGFDYTSGDLHSR